MEKHFIIAFIWLGGFLLSRWMLKAEYKAEGKQLTYGDETACVLLSLFSFGMVLFILASAWADKVKPYWKQPVSKNKKPE